MNITLILTEEDELPLLIQSVQRTLWRELEIDVETDGNNRIICEAYRRLLKKLEERKG